MDAVVKRKPLIVHVIHRLDTGGMENGLVNLINRMPEDFCDHAIVCLTDYTDFSKRITRSGIAIYALHKKPGHDIGVYWRLWRLLRKLKPQIVHTRNLAALEMAPIAMLAGVKHRVHGEHGRDIFDLDGSNPKYRLLRRICDRFVSCYITVSKDLYRWLVDDLRFAADKVTQIYNGVDNSRFKSFEPAQRRDAYPAELRSQGLFVIGTVGRLQQVKNQRYLIEGFAFMLRQNPRLQHQARLAIVGDGGCRAELEQLAVAEAVQPYIWFAGDRVDVPALLAGFDLFVLPSLAEGISNTILEAMSAGLPVLATRVGGNPELVEDGVTGRLIELGRADLLAVSMLRYIDDRSLLDQGSLGRKRIEQQFSWDAAVNAYQAVYTQRLSQ